jgi:hypothetical protein
MSEYINSVNQWLGLPAELQNVETYHRVNVMTASYLLLWLYDIALVVFAALGLTDTWVIILDGWIVLIAINLFWLATLLGIWWGLATNGATMNTASLVQILILMFCNISLLQWISWLVWYTTLEDRVSAALYYSVSSPSYLMREYSYFFTGVLIYFTIFTMCLLADIVNVYYKTVTAVEEPAELPEDENAVLLLPKQFRRQVAKK